MGFRANSQGVRRISRIPFAIPTPTTSKSTKLIRRLKYGPVRRDLNALAVKMPDPALQQGTSSGGP